MYKTRVAITGIGVVAPNGIGTDNFLKSLKNGESGIEQIPELQEMDFRCQVAGIPKIPAEVFESNFNKLTQRFLTASGIIYGVIAAKEAWQQSGLPLPEKDKSKPAKDFGTIFGSGMSGPEPYRKAILGVDEGNVKRLGSRVVEQVMTSGISAKLGGIFGLGNKVSTNAAACATGTEAIIDAAEHIKSGKANVMITGSCEGSGPYVWGGFDSMRVLCRKYNDTPKTASCPMSANSAGLVPSAGAGALVLENMEYAKKRGATILAEYTGGFTNAGGQLQGGTLTAPNTEAMLNCIKSAMEDSKIADRDVSLINGHLTSTMSDPLEVKNWHKVFSKNEKKPYLQSTKSMIGHSLSASGAIEAVACVLQLQHNFVHPSINALPLHEKIDSLWPRNKIPQKSISTNLTSIISASFGFGDVNACCVIEKHK